MTDAETLAYDRGLKDGIEAAHQVQDLVLSGLGYNAVQALDIVIGLLSLSSAITAEIPAEPERGR